MALIKTLLLDAFNVTLVSATIATIAALTVAKAILIMDSLALSNKFSARPLVYEILWKTLLYTLLVLVFRIMEEFIPLWMKYGDFRIALQNFADEISWPYVWATQIMLVVFIILYNVSVALSRHFGAASVRNAMFGR